MRSTSSTPVRMRWCAIRGDAGSLLIWTGFALTSRSAPVVVAVAALLGTAYQRRITAEEVLLRRELPAYASYCERTKKLIPLLW